jgi:hypothetical protein
VTASPESTPASPPRADPHSRTAHASQDTLRCQTKNLWLYYTLIRPYLDQWRCDTPLFVRLTSGRSQGAGKAMPRRVSIQRRYLERIPHRDLGEKITVFLGTSLEMRGESKRASQQQRHDRNTATSEQAHMSQTSMPPKIKHKLMLGCCSNAEIVDLIVNID